MKKQLASMAICLGILASTAVSAYAQTNCRVEQAAQAALEREIELIKALATDPKDSFRGPESCISGDILSSFDLSNAIPDLAGMMQSLSMDAINNAIQSAQQQVCRQINEAVSGAIGKAQVAISNFNSNLTGELDGILSNGWSNLSF